MVKKVSNADIKAAYKAAFENRSTGFVEPADGKYTAKLSKAEMVVSEKSNLPQVVLEFKIIGGDENGKTKRVWLTLDPANEMTMQISVNTLAKIGVEAEDPESIEELLKEKVGALYSIQIKTKGEYTNLYVDKPLDEDGAEASEDEATEVADTEVEAESEEAEVPVKKASPKKGAAKKVVTPEPDVEDEVAEVAPEEPAEEEVELKKGMAILVHPKKDPSKTLPGKVVKVDEAAGKVYVTLDKDNKTADKGKTYAVSPEQLELPTPEADEAPAEEEEI